MEPQGVTDPLSVRRLTRDPQRNPHRGGQEFEREFEQQAEGDPVEKRDSNRRKRLQLEPEIRRKTPSDGDFHIDVVV